MMGLGMFITVGLLMILINEGKGMVIPDPVPHALVITGIVVAVSATTLGLALMLQVQAETDHAVLPGDSVDVLHEASDASSKEKVK